MYNQIAIQPQHIKSCNPSPTHHPVGVGLHARPRGLSGHLTLTSIIQLPYTNTPTSCSRGQADRQTDRQTDRPFILINHSSFAIKMSQPNINTPNSDLVSSLSQSQSYLSPNFLVILPGLTSSVRLCGVERCPAQQSEEEEEESRQSIFIIFIHTFRLRPSGRAAWLTRSLSLAQPQGRRLLSLLLQQLTGDLYYYY